MHTELLLLSRRAPVLAERIRELFAQLQGLDSKLASQLLGSLCEEPGTKVVPRAAEETWVTRDGRRFDIGDMPPEHLAHTLAYIVRTARDEGHCWGYRVDGALRRYPRWPNLEA